MSETRAPCFHSYSATFVAEYVMNLGLWDKKLKIKQPLKVRSEGTKLLHLQHKSQTRSDVMHALVSKIKLTGHTKKAIAIFERPLTAKIQFSADNTSQGKPANLTPDNVTLHLSLSEIDHTDSTVVMTYFMSSTDETPLRTKGRMQRAIPFLSVPFLSITRP